MFTPDTCLLVMREKHRDQLKNLERHQLLQAAELQPKPAASHYRTVVCWLGKQMVKWGSKLENFDKRPASDAV